MAIFLQLNNIQKSVSFAQDFLAFIVWKSDEKVILFSLPAYGTINARPIFLCRRGPLITVWICNTYRWEVEYKLEYNPYKIRASFFRLLPVLLILSRNMFCLLIIINSLLILLSTLWIIKYFFYILNSVQCKDTYRPTEQESSTDCLFLFLLKIYDTNQCQDI